MKTYRYITKSPRFLLLGLLFYLLTFVSAQGQPKLIKDYSFVMEIPDIETIESSYTHLYVLSDTEGLAVFRTNPDTLQWLYTSPGMERRGSRLSADIRFAYLYSGNQKFTVLEPTSVLGVYSSTDLPAKPRGVRRQGTDLYLALADRGLGKLSLESPSSVDSAITYVARDITNGGSIIDLARSMQTLYVLSANAKIYELRHDGVTLNHVQTIDLPKKLEYLAYSGTSLYGGSSQGDIYRIRPEESTQKVGSIPELPTKIRTWKDWVIARDLTGRLWTSYRGDPFKIWKDNPKAGNYFTINKGQFWINEFNKISRVKSVETRGGRQQDTLDGLATIQNLHLNEISGQTVSLPHPALIPIELEENYPVSAIQYTYKSPTIENAHLRKQGFYWQPNSEDVGSHRVTIIATANSGASDSLRFNIEVRSFNAPPRFSPLRPMTIPVDKTFTLPLNARDPDGITPGLIRYIGMNLPEGASLNEKTGMFKWKPSQRQTGENEFKVIATDQYGAASSVTITLNVKSMSKN